MGINIGMSRYVAPADFSNVRAPASPATGSSSGEGAGALTTLRDVCNGPKLTETVSVPVGRRAMVMAPFPGDAEHLVARVPAHYEIDAQGYWEAVTFLKVAMIETIVPGGDRRRLSRQIEKLAHGVVEQDADVWGWQKSMASLGRLRLQLAERLKQYPQDPALLWCARKTQHSLIDVALESTGRWWGSAGGRCSELLKVGSELLSEANEQRRAQGETLPVPHLKSEGVQRYLSDGCSLL